MTVQTLYRKNALGIGMWSIWNEENVIKISHSSTLDGAKIQHEEIVHVGKQSRSLLEQVQHRIASRISKQKDKGYVEDVELAAKSLLNQLGLDVPMLAQTYKGQDLSKGAHIQRKLNGLRCLATKQDGKIIMYSRKGKPFTALHEIAKELDHLINEGETFDGELYCHRTSLQRIQSWAKRRQKDTLHLSYYIYDYMDDQDFVDRLAKIDHAFNSLAERGIEYAYISKLPTKLISTKAELDDAMLKARAAGFEGLMVKLNGYEYENGKRSASILKVKDVFSDEAICTDIVLSEKGNPVLWLSWNGHKFKASPPGGHSDWQNAYNNKDKYIGSRVTFEYREITDDGVPFHAVATAWRID